MTTLAVPYAEGIPNQIKTQDCVVRVHTADPGNANINGATLSNGSILGADWSAYVDSNGGRGMTNNVEISFGNATVVETLTHYSLWQLDGTTFILSDALSVSQTTVVGNPVRFPAGTLLIVGRGAP